MAFSAIDHAAARTDPVYRIRPKTWGPAPVAGPVALMGTAAGRDVAYLTELARALASADAANVAVFPPREVTTPGWILDREA